MAVSVAMPLLSPTMTEGKIAKWNKKEGDAVKAGDALAEVETDKATLDLEAYDAGTLLKILVPAGGTVKVGATVAVVGKPGEDITALLGAAPAAAKPAPAPTLAPAPARPAPAPVAAPAPAPAPAPVAGRGGRVRSSPLARRMARERGLELGRLSGSGPAGRVIARDVEAALQSGAARPAQPAQVAQAVEGEEIVPLTTMRKVIAERLVAAKRDVPHFYLTVDIDMEKVVALRAELKEAGAQASINDFIVKACAMAMMKVPSANRSWGGESGYIQHKSADIGVAVALEDGLLTPVIHAAHQKTVTAIAAEVKELAERARNRKLLPHEYQGGSMAVSNLGMYGIDSFAAVVNPPQSCILAVGAVSDKVVAVNGQPAVRKRMTVTLSCDHRVVDGALGAKLLAEIRGLLEKPLQLGF